uniref:Uncharacterized protein n=1 Tax=Arundo donax TaxID=35708 RepID=A0A0A9BFU4_ARUDO
MGRPRGGKAKRTTSQATKNEDADAGSGDEEAVIPAYNRRGRTQKHIKADTDEEEDDVKVEEDSDAAKPIVPSKGASVENGGKKRRRQPKRGCDSVVAEKDEPVRQNGFRQHGSRRKNTPRRAAEAGVDCNK